MGTALHQACYHNRPEIVRTLLELGAYELCAHLPSNPCGRGGSGFPIDLARGGGHHGIVAQLEKYAANHAKADIPQAIIVKPDAAFNAAGSNEFQLEFLGLWRDTGDRAMPIKLGVNPSDADQNRRGVLNLLRELQASSAPSGIVAFQSYNQVHWSSDPNEQGYKKHGFIGMGPPCRSSWSNRVHACEGMRVEGVAGVFDVLGGDWQNAVYRITRISGGAAVGIEF